MFLDVFIENHALPLSIDEIYTRALFTPTNNDQFGTNGIKGREFLIKLTTITEIILIGYAIMVFIGPSLLKFSYIDPWRPRWLIATWNLMLAIFSGFGAYYHISFVIHQLSTVGFHQFTCHDGVMFYFGPRIGRTTLYFGLSKYVELVDTFWLIIGGRKLIFLHWYHHMTVLIYVRMIIISMAPMGPWFSSMNYFVHTIMYSYYFFSQIKDIVPVFHLLYPYRTCITLIQITQMVGGLIITSYVYYMGDNACPGNSVLCVKYGFYIYLSYFVLFVKFFINAKKTRSSKSKSLDNKVHSN